MKPKKILYFIILSSFLCLACGAQSNRVAILGESFSSENGLSGINEEVLGRLFSLIREKQPDAVIFTGNMTLGLEANPSKEVDFPLIYPLAPIEKGSEQDQFWPRKGFWYNNSHFQKQLKDFLNIKKRQLGEKIPFYPIIGKHEVLGPDAANLVLKAFNVKSSVSGEVSALAYTFALKNALFILFSNAYFSLQTHSAIVHKLNDQLLDWLSRTLKKERDKYDFTFVVGNEPAFSTTGASGTYFGLDNEPNSRNRFWQILLEHQVTAYFCSGEHLYDRTNRYGIWQIISGGAGAPLYKRQFDKAFYHFLLLTIPASKQDFPKIQVYDSQGNLSDEFDLPATRYPIYQLRISML